MCGAMSRADTKAMPTKLLKITPSFLRESTGTSTIRISLLSDTTKCRYFKSVNKWIIWTRPRTPSDANRVLKTQWYLRMQVMDLKIQLDPFTAELNSSISAKISNQFLFTYSKFRIEEQLQAANYFHSLIFGMLVR